MKHPECIHPLTDLGALLLIVVKGEAVAKRARQATLVRATKEGILDEIEMMLKEVPTK